LSQNGVHVFRAILYNNFQLLTPLDLTRARQLGLESVGH